ncbi:MAG: heavy-metal-associated domain-containing protein [Acidimicrobiales bacterium]|nr:heavy-metal-associated domain-containing protein [Acidimicrobiales bacterium]
MSTTATYAVTGMNCQHCVDSVTREVSKLDGVTGVAVDLAAGSVAVTSASPLDLEAVRAAVDEAGFDLAASEG